MRKLMVTLGVFALLSGPALAQQRFQFFGFGGGGVELLLNPSVQKELKLSEEQSGKAKEAVTKIREKFGDDLKRFRELSNEERETVRKKMADANTKAVEEILKPDQLKRYKQIQLQQRGVNAFAEAEVQAALKLSDEQKEKLKTLQEDLRRDMAELRKEGAGGNFQEIGKKIAARNKEAMTKTMETLNDDQKKAWKELTGEPFELKPEQRRRPKPPA